MKMLGFVLVFALPQSVHGKAAVDIRCLVSLAQQVGPSSNTFSLDTSPLPVIFNYSSNEGKKTVLLVAERSGIITPGIERYSLRSAKAGDDPTVSIVLDFKDYKDIEPRISTEMSSDDAITSSVGMSLRNFGYAQGVMVKLKKFWGLVTLSCLRLS